MNSDAVEQEHRADAFAGAGDLTSAREILEALVATAPNVERWLKLGSIRRATGAVKPALEAVQQALVLAPLDFMALLSRASLLEILGDPKAGEAFAWAVAQRPLGTLTPPVARMLEYAEAQSAAFVRSQEETLLAAIGPALLRTSEASAFRMRRFVSNTVRRTKVFHSEPSQFYFPGLRELEFHDREAFPWLATLESATQIIATEFETVVKAERAELVPYIQYAAHEPLGQWKALNLSRDWTAIHLIQNGTINPINAQYCPQTMALLATLPQPEIAGCSANAMFSLLAPGAKIPPHTGVTNTRLVCHLPLVVPNGCWFRVGAETRTWERGKAFVFDDTIEHEAANTSDAPRVVFIVDVWHPGLSEEEKDGVRAVMEALP